MILMENKIEWLAGAMPVSPEPWEIFSSQSLSFLDALSQELFHVAKGEFPEVAALAFWLRCAHLLRVRAEQPAGQRRMGRGLAFHLTPANVPAMFAYSFAISLLAGNANIVRVSEGTGKTGDVICRVMKELLRQPEFSEFARRNAFIRYEHDEELTRSFLEKSDVRVLWGGDETVKKFRSAPSKPQAVDLCFPDRQSIAIFSRSAVSDADEESLNRLARYFYNDSYSMDQNACSSPRIVFWLEDQEGTSGEQCFWERLSVIAQQEYPLDFYRVSRKYEKLCCTLMEENLPCVNVKSYGGNMLYVISLPAVPVPTDRLNGAYGLFFEFHLNSLEDLVPFLTEKTQTLSYFGLDPEKIADLLMQYRVRGVNRIVPTGQALSMDFIWDGKDLIAEMSSLLQVV